MPHAGQHSTQKDDGNPHQALPTVAWHLQSHPSGYHSMPMGPGLMAILHPLNTTYSQLQNPAWHVDGTTIMAAWHLPYGSNPRPRTNCQPTRTTECLPNAPESYNFGWNCWPYCHTGTTILPHTLIQPRQENPMGLDTISNSTLQWPWTHTPLKVCWKLWTKTICSVFTGSPTGSHLHHPPDNGLINTKQYNNGIGDYPWQDVFCIRSTAKTACEQQSQLSNNELRLCSCQWSQPIKNSLTPH